MGTALLPECTCGAPALAYMADDWRCHACYEATLREASTRTAEARQRQASALHERLLAMSPAYAAGYQATPGTVCPHAPTTLPATLWALGQLRHTAGALLA